MFRKKTLRPRVFALKKISVSPCSEKKLYPRVFALKKSLCPRVPKKNFASPRLCVKKNLRAPVFRKKTLRPRVFALKKHFPHQSPPHTGKHRFATHTAYGGTFLTYHFHFVKSFLHDYEIKLVILQPERQPYYISRAIRPYISHTIRPYISQAIQPYNRQ